MSVAGGLRKKVEGWVEVGIISADQATKIYAHEDEVSSRNTIAFALGWLATACIGLGIIALVASNWEAIPPSVKLVAYFVLYAALALALLHPWTDRGHWREMLRLALMIFTMAGIGLIAQIFNLHSESWRGTLFWCGMTLPLALTATSPLGAVLWYPVLLFTYFEFSNQHHPADMDLATVLLFAITGILSTLLINKVPPLKNFRRIAGTLAIAATLLFLAEGPKINRYGLFGSHYLRMYWSVGLGLVVWALSVFLQKRYAPGIRYGFVAFCAVGICSALLSENSSMLLNHPILFELIYAIVFTFGTLALAVAVFAAGSHRAFEWLCGLIFIRWLFVYGSTMMSLAWNGFGLISIGIIILLLVTQWKKIKPRLYHAIEERIHDQN